MTTDSAGHIPQLTLPWRLKMSLSDDHMAVGDMAEYLGVSRQTLSRWMNGTGASPKRAYLMQWSLKTGVPLEWLEHGVAPPNGGDDGDELPWHDSNVQPSGLRPRLRLPSLLPLLAA